MKSWYQLVSFLCKIRYKIKNILSKMDMDYTFIMYCHGKQRFSAVSSPDGLLKHIFGVIFHFLENIHFFLIK